MPAQSLMWELLVFLVPVLVMATALLMERVERHMIGTRSARPANTTQTALEAM